MGDIFDSADEAWLSIEPSSRTGNARRLPLIVTFSGTTESGLRIHDQFVVFNRTDFWGFQTQTAAESAAKLWHSHGEKVAWTDVGNFRANKDYLMGNIEP